MSGVWDWFFPPRIDVPDCARELLEYLYPTVDWSRVTFHLGIPSVLRARDMNAITIPRTLTIGRVGIYFKPGTWDPSTCAGLGLMVHEGFHVLQMQQTWNGFGLGLFHPRTMAYLAAYVTRGGYGRHPAEAEAYAVGGRPDALFERCCTPDAVPCDGSVEPVALNRDRLEAFKRSCSTVVQPRARGSWESFFESVPGRQILEGGAHRLWRARGLARLPAAIGGVLLWGTHGALATLWLAGWTIAAAAIGILAAAFDLIGAVIGTAARAATLGR